MATTAQGTLFQAGNGAVPELFTTVADIVSITGPSLSHEPVDITDLSDTARQFLPALVYDGGEITLELNFDADDTLHDAFVDRVIAGSTDNYQICWSNLAAHSKAFVPADVTVAADTIDEGAHGLATGQPIRFTTDDTMPAPLVANTTYYVIRVDAGTISVASTNALAVAGTAIDLTTQGVGNHNIKCGSRYDLTLSVSGAEPSGAVGDKLSASVTFKVVSAVTINI